MYIIVTLEAINGKKSRNLLVAALLMVSGQLLEFKGAMLL